MAIGGAATAGTGWHSIATNFDRRRNVVLIVVDTLRADHLGCYGGSARTPNIDMLAEQSVRFTRVYPEAMPTGPARRSILTGRRTFPFHGWQPWESLGKTPGWAPIRPETPTLVSTLGHQGYRTVCVTDNPFLNYAPPFRPLRRSFDRFVAIPGQARPRRPFDHVSAREAARLLPRSRVREDARHVETMRWYLAANGGGGADVDERETAAARTFSTAAWALRKASAQRPFLLVVDGFDPHEPWAVPRRYLDLYRPPGDDGPAIGDIGYTPTGELTASELRRLRATYAASVTMVDRWVGYLLDTLERLRLDDNTVVMLVSDHGIHLGEDDWIGKSAWRLTSPLTRVPLIVRHPDGAGAGTASDWFATTHDLAPTLTSLARASRPPVFEGADLSPILTGGEPARPRPLAYGGYSNHLFVRDDRWAMVSNNLRTGQMLFDLESDPEERHDISREHPAVVERLYRRMVEDVGSEPPWYGPEALEAEPRRAPADW